jgi:hypothetical protein
MKKAISITVLLISLALAWAGTENGNGARAVVVRYSSGTVAYTLTDFWEAEQPYFDFVQSGNANSYRRLKSDETNWRRIYNGQRDVFLSKANRSGRYGRAFAADFVAAERTLQANPPVRKKKCPQQGDVDKRTFSPFFDVIQAFVTPRNDPKSACIDEGFAIHADPLNRAAAQFHEVVYFAAAGPKYRHTRSDPTRQLTAMVFSSGFPEMKLSNFSHFLSWYLKANSVGVSLEKLSTLNSPGELVKQLMPGGRFHLAHAAEFSNRSWSRISIRQLSRLDVNAFECADGFQLRKEMWNRPFGREVQIFVVPDSGSYRVTQGSRWLPHPAHDFRDASFVGPFPFAVLTYTDQPGESFYGRESSEIVLISHDMKTVLWSLDGDEGICKRKRA